MKLPFTDSLRARLLFFLLASIFAAALVQAVVAYRSTLAQTDAIFDAQLRSTAISLSTGDRRLSAMPSPVPGEPSASVDDLIIQIWTAEGVQLYRSSSGRLLPDPVVLGFSTARAGDDTFRVFAMATPFQVTQVAQDMRVRSATARALALRSVGPIVAAAPLLMLVVWWVVSRSLRPVARTRAQLAARRPDDLSPVSEAGLPDEIRPLVQELNLLLERVRQAFALQRQFVGDAAHELRTPLAALALQLQGLRRATDGAGREQAIGRLAEGVERATRLIEQLLSMARYDAGSAAPQPVPTDLVQAVREAVSMVLPLANARRIDIALEGPDAARVDGEADALVLMVRNLLDNAVKYTPEGGQVIITVTPAAAGAGATLTVDDNGPGIPAAERERVFDRFYRAHAGAVPGSGLGLSLVRTLARRHGARVSLHDAPAGGLRARVDFPPPASSAPARLSGTP
ncbi:ATP-binding protein [Bordetella sp. 2513F-2]